MAYQNPLYNWVVFHPLYDGFSKVLFPISAKNRIPCVTPLVLLVKKVILKIQVKCSKSTNLEKKWFVSCKKS